MEAKYKVGDKVTIKRTRNGSSSDYRFSFTDVMVRECGGECYTIKSVCKADSFSSSRVPDDGYSYSLEEVGFTWASSMFEESSDAALDLVHHKHIVNHLSGTVSHIGNSDTKTKILSARPSIFIIISNVLFFITLNVSQACNIA